MKRCPSTAPQLPIPAGLSNEAAQTHPRWKSWLGPGARCELDNDHDGPHRNGLLLWHDPPKVVVSGDEQ